MDYFKVSAFKSYIRVLVLIRVRISSRVRFRFPLRYGLGLGLGIPTILKKEFFGFVEKYL